MSRLYIYPKKGDSFHYDLQDEKIAIGRAAENEIPLPDPFCSSKHGFIHKRDNTYFVRDNQSKNGIFLNGKRIQYESELKKGDEILLGSTRITFDLGLDTKVEVTDIPSSSENINTIMHLKDILKKPDISTTVRADAKSLDLEAIKSQHKDFSVISEVSKALILHKPLDELLEHIMDLICENVEMDRGIIMLNEGHPPQPIPKVIRIRNKRLANQTIQVSQSILNTAMEKHSSILISDVQSDARFKAQDSIIKMNIQSAMCVPLWNNREIIGIIYSDRMSFHNQFTNEDLRLLTLLSNLAAVKIENARNYEKALEQEKMKKELELAAQIQKDLLPKKNPEYNNYEIVGTNIPCYQVGGDYYDFVEIDKDRIGIVIADVSGKGVSSSLVMASLRGAIHSEVHKGYSIENMASNLNTFVHESTPPNSFITFFFCELNTNTGELLYVNSGHNPPIILDKRKKPRRLETCGLCLGMFPDQAYEVKKTSLNPGETAILYTDGFTEIRNKSNIELEEKGLIQLLKKNANLPAGDLMGKICSEVESFAEGTSHMDDMTLVIIKRAS